MLNCLSTYMKKSDSRAEGRRKKRPTKLTIFFEREKDADYQDLHRPLLREEGDGAPASSGTQ